MLCDTLTPTELIATVPAPDWMAVAACKGRTPLFFPPKAERPQARERREAKARRICAGCPVLEPCREFARRHHEYGFWAGESEEDRHLAGFTVSAPIGIRARGVHPLTASTVQACPPTSCRASSPPSSATTSIMRSRT